MSLDRSIRRLTLAILLLLWTLVFGEIFLRLAAPQSLMPRYVTGTPYGVRGNIPGAVYHHSTPDVEIDLRINRQGMRDDREFAVAKPAGTCRIAMLGDSYFVGYELPLPLTFARQIERRLRARGFPVEVLNFAVSGLGTAENLRTYEAAARPFAPDLVLMQWQVTDYDDNIRSGLYKLRDGRLVGNTTTFLPGIATQDRLMRYAAYRLLADRSHLYNFAREEIGWKAKQLLAFVRKRADGSDDREVEQNTYVIGNRQVALAAAILRRADAEVRADGARMMIVDIPNRTPDRIFGSSFSLMPPDIERTVSVVQVVDRFRKAARDPANMLFYRHGARHLTPLGAKLLAEATVERIEGTHALDTCRRSR
ncbi:SGNH/GDSL hydrolase family protein [Sphingomonas sp. R86520]|uniref:SGNH/GDSL hydrolase family protein n=1 Tax=Sphingomonas sp. R86520 TaxID=3093859 RepID=UPI0036D328B7